MKNQKNNILFLSLLLGTILCGQTTTVHALDLKGVIGKLKLNVDMSSKKTSSEDLLAPPPQMVQFNVVKNSKFEMNLSLHPEVKFLKFLIIKDEDTKNFENLVLPVTTAGSFLQNIYLSKGIGEYKIRVYASKSADKTINNAFDFLKEYAVGNEDTRDLQYLGPSQMVQSDLPEIMALAKKVTKGAFTSRSIIIKIHEYIIKNVKYDHESYNNKTYLTNPYDALSVLHKPLTVCAGYSNLFAALARASGVKARVINGDALIDGGLQIHAWNEVYLDGKWEIIDSTWNVDRKDNKYLFIKPELFAEDHTKTAVLDY